MALLNSLLGSLLSALRSPRVLIPVLLLFLLLLLCPSSTLARSKKRRKNRKRRRKRSFPSLSIDDFISGSAGVAAYHISKEPLLSEAQLDELISHFPAHDVYYQEGDQPGVQTGTGIPAWSRQADSIDNRPAYEFYSFLHGANFNPPGYDPINAIVNPLVQEVVLPFVRDLYDAPDAVHCYTLIRRYLPGERAGVKAHQDLQAFATTVLTLDIDGGVEGGLYVKNTIATEEETLVPLKRGHAVVHRDDLVHGVRLTFPPVDQDDEDGDGDGEQGEGEGGGGGLGRPPAALLDGPLVQKDGGRLPLVLPPHGRAQPF